MENNNQKIGLIIILSTVLFLAIIFIGMTYAFFTANNPEGSTAEIISKTGRMVINYDDGTDIIQPVTGIVPSNAILVDKTFTITALNTTKDMYMPLTLSLEYTNTFQNNELLYFIKITESSNTKMYNGKVNAYEITEDLITSMGWSNELLEYTYNPIEDWSGNLYTQKVYELYLLPNQNEVSITFNFKMMFPDNNRDQSYNKGATFNGKFVVDTDNANIFAIDSWETIAKNVKNGNIGNYPVGAEKEVEIDGKSYTVRVANNTKPEECTREDFSQTACGFVVEFADIVEDRAVNSIEQSISKWTDTELYSYLNNEFIKKLPTDLQNVILDTKVITSYGFIPDTGNYDKNSSREDGNWETVDKVYLLSKREVMELTPTIDYTDVEFDPIYNSSRQLDYYKNKGVTDMNNTFYLLKYNGTSDWCWWWLRASPNGNSSLYVDEYGIGYSKISDEKGVAPAFRIG